MIDKQRLINKAALFSIDIAHCVDSLALYAELLVEYNKKVNLTAITTPEGIEDRHFIDCILFASQDEVKGKVCDVGTGAGFPGIVAKLFKPDIELTLIEPTGKKLEFLKYACDALGIKAELAKERAEEAARKKWRESFDIATARAVAALNILSEYCLPLVKQGGLFIAMKGDVSEEKQSLYGALEKLGGEYAKEKKFILPDSSKRTLCFIKKVSATALVYPRNGGKIVKSPLK